MAEPIRTYTPQRDVREELRRKVENAPVEHAEALLATYELLQEAQNHGVLDALRGAIGAGEVFISKGAEYANTPEGTRALRNLLAMARLLGDIDPEMLNAIRQAYNGSIRKKDAANYELPTLWQTLHRLTGPESRRTLAMLAGFSESFGGALIGQSGSNGERKQTPRGSGIAVPVVFSAVLVMLASLWIGRRSSSR